MSRPVQHAPLMLSVSGARGIVGKSMTPSVAVEFAAAFGSFIRQTSRLKQPLLCVGRDSRPSGEMLADAAIAGLASVGCRVINLGLVTTPTVSVMIGRHRAQGGMVVTASHNPIEWNGLKCLNADGAAPPPRDVEEILLRFREKEFAVAGPDQAPDISRDDSGHETHVANVLANIDADAIRAVRFRIVLDSVNGAGCIPGKMLLEKLGCEVIHLNGEANGQFAHPPEPTEENLRDLAAVTKVENAACGFAQDPDADRLAIVDEHGRYIGEEYTLVLAALRVLEMRGPGVIAANLSTSRMTDDVATRFGATVVRTAVGEANVVAAMKAHKAILGGEGNGGVIFPPVCLVRDSLSSMALVLSLLAHRRSRLSTAPLSDILAELPRYEMIKHKFDAAQLGGSATIKSALDRVANRFANARVNTSDGIRIDFEDGWVHLRPSNTEPIVRLIAEAKTRERAWELIDEVAVAAGLR